MSDSWRRAGDRARPGSENDWKTISEVVRRVHRSREQHGAASHSARGLSLAAWAAQGGFFVDREAFSFDRWRYLRPIYEAIPPRPADFEMVVMKGAQAGASTLSMLFAVWLALRERVQIAYYLPTVALSHVFSSTRFIQLVRGNPEIHRLMGDAKQPGTRRVIDEGSASIRRVADSIIHFLCMTGKISTEALPLDARTWLMNWLAGAIDQRTNRVLGTQLMTPGAHGACV